VTEKYQSVNGAWPDNLPIPTGEEAATAARRLYRLIMGQPFKGPVKIVSGNRYTYVRGGVLHVNPNGQHFGGWKDLVHGLSHHCHRRKFPGHKPHDGRGTHAFIEKEMIEHVVNSGWLDGKLKKPERVKPGKAAVQATRHARVLASIKRWESKRKRADTALKKLARQKRYYERSLAN